MINGNQEITEYNIVLNTFLNETMPDALCALLDWFYYDDVMCIYMLWGFRENWYLVRFLIILQ